MTLSRNDAKLIHHHLAGTGWMQLATIRDGRPQLAHLWFAHDEELNMYYSSRTTRRHSENIVESPEVAGGVALPPFDGLGTYAYGLTFEGTVTEVASDQLDQAYSIYRARWPYASAIITPEKIRTNRILNRFYKITPHMFRIFDESRFTRDNPRDFQV